MTDTLRPKPELLIFDLGRVLVDFNFQKVIEHLGRFSPLSHKDIHRHFLTTTSWDVFERGRMSPEAFFKELCVHLKLKNLSHAAFIALWNDIFTEKSDTVAILRRLRANYRLAMLSNVNIVHWEHLRGRHDFMHWFDYPVASYAVGQRKPDSDIYRTVLHRANVSPQKALFIDDIEAHVLAARTMGLRAHLFVNARQLLQDLEGVLE